MLSLAPSLCHSLLSSLIIFDPFCHPKPSGDSWIQMIWLSSVFSTWFFLSLSHFWDIVNWKLESITQIRISSIDVNQVNALRSMLWELRTLEKGSFQLTARSSHCHVNTRQRFVGEEVRWQFDGDKGAWRPQHPSRVSQRVELHANRDATYVNILFRCSQPRWVLHRCTKMKWKSSLTLLFDANTRKRDPKSRLHG